MARIMIAEDLSTARMLLKDTLAIGNHEVVAEAADGTEVVEKFITTRPDLILLDLAMPKKDGLQAIKGN